jgi:Putative transposase
LHTLSRKPQDAKPAFGGPLQVLRYLGRYTHRVAISNYRLLAFDQERVTFRWKDYARAGKQGEMTLSATEFLRRFFLHVLPKGFVRIRHFGFLANRFRASHLALG